MIKSLFAFLLTPIALIANPLPLVDFNVEDFSVEGNQVTLRGGGQITHKNDTLSFNDEIRVEMQEAEGGKKMKVCHASGKMEYVRRNEEGETILSLVCTGTVCMDVDRYEIQMEKGPNEEQICFTDQQGALYADRLFVNFADRKAAIHPTLVRMQGNVRIHHRFPGMSQVEGETKQYALADQVQYDPATQEILITAHKGERVLLIDDLNHLQMSAPGIRIQRDPVTKKEKVQGIGDVRLQFKKEELEKMKRQFDLGDKA